MADQVKLKLNTNVVGSKDVEINISTSGSGKLGTILISKGNIEWLPAWNSVKKHRMPWRKFAEVMEREGKLARVKR
jgi:hypothetical protein